MLNLSAQPPLDLFIVILKGAIRHYMLPYSTSSCHEYDSYIPEHIHLLITCSAPPS